MNRFYGWLLLFFVLLITIPLLLVIGWIVPAKILGVLTVLMLSFSVRIWLYRTKKQYDPKERVRLNLNDRFWMKREFQFYNQLSSKDRVAFEDRLGIFLSRVPVCYSSGELVKDRTSAIRIATHVLLKYQNFEDDRLHLPTAIIIESDIWDDRMNSLRTQEGVIVLLSSAYL